MKEMFLETQSEYGFNETLSRLEKIIQEKKWGLKHTHDLKEMLHEKDLQILPARVLEVCKPTYAYELMSKDALKIYSNMMPCRISIFEKENGKVYVSRMNNGLFAAQIGGVVEKVMGSAFEEVEGIIEEATQ